MSKLQAHENNLAPLICSSPPKDLQHFLKSPQIACALDSIYIN